MPCVVDIAGVELNRSLLCCPQQEMVGGRFEVPNNARSPWISWILKHLIDKSTCGPDHIQSVLVHVLAHKPKVLADMYITVLAIVDAGRLDNFGDETKSEPRDCAESFEGGLVATLFSVFVEKTKLSLVKSLSFYRASWM